MMNGDDDDDDDDGYGDGDDDDDDDDGYGDGDGDDDVPEHPIAPGLFGLMPPRTKLPLSPILRCRWAPPELLRERRGPLCDALSVLLWSSPVGFGPVLIHTTCVSSCAW